MWLKLKFVKQSGLGGGMKWVLSYRDPLYMYMYGVLKLFKVVFTGGNCIVRLTDMFLEECQTGNEPHRHTHMLNSLVLIN